MAVELGSHGIRVNAYPAASPELLARIDEFLAAERLDPGLIRVLTERRDIVQRALRSRELAG